MAPSDERTFHPYPPYGSSRRAVYLLDCGHRRVGHDERDWYTGSWWCRSCGGRPRSALAVRVPSLNAVSFTVLGTARPQGSKRHVGGGRMVEMGKDLKPWRNAVAIQAAEAMDTQPYAGPVRVKLTFFLIRPKGHFGTGRNALSLKPSAPKFPTGTPDIDKLTRAVLDALTGIVFRDDGQVQSIDAMKLYSDEHYPGVVVEVVPRES